MRIALVDPSLFTLPYDRALARGLAAGGHDVTLYARRPGADDPGAQGLNLVASFYRFTSSRPVARLPRPLRLGIKGIDHIASMRGLLRRLRADPPDIIHFQWLPLPLLDRILLAGFRRVAPLVLTVHDTAHANGDPAAAVRRRGFLACLPLFETLIVHTGQGRARLLAQGIAEPRLALLPHGLLDEPPPLAAPPDPMLGELTFLLFGKIKPYKGADLLIEAFALLPPALRAQARLRVVGKPYMPLGPLEELVQARALAGRVGIEPRFVDDREIPALFAPGVVAVFPYREIEASGVLSLALAHGRPVIASRLGSFAETLEDGGHGLLTPAGDVPALAAALARLIADRDFAAACGRRARALAAATPRWEEIGRRTAGCYDRARSRFAARFIGRPLASLTLD